MCVWNLFLRDRITGRGLDLETPWRTILKKVWRSGTAEKLSIPREVSHRQHELLINIYSAYKVLVVLNQVIFASYVFVF